ncbi:response regulator transcription factor [Candidatus Marinarcus aquaticus]|uniref:DNA-binding response regulator n=1 Tax=Candidatus Marinarcus aquaticus TaxID=2044504 RepID=A0A4Q0XRT0_9BACT|nr:response regulator transcription factor [Candidatus Marinarcus aquaticus]RXJ55270.1 DNA-binding response regulator [Candidatus Marinarcus aquaticus]
MKNRHVLLIEDNLELQTLICNFLKDYNYTCSAYSQPLEALKEFETNHLKYAIIILDLGLPRMDGFDLFKKIKEIKNTPIIISTARDDIGNKIYGFELGADDYLSKPYEPRELVLRIDATLKRYTNDDVLEMDELLIDVNNKRAFLEEQEIEFTKIESEIFFMFIKNINKVVSREDIVNQTSLKNDTKNRTIDMHVSNIRFKINDDSKEPKYIKSVWGIGYKFIHDH